jgi:hypothetical protein
LCAGFSKRHLKIGSARSATQLCSNHKRRRTARDRTEASALDPEDGDPMTAEVGDVHAMDNTEAGVDNPSGSAATTAEAETSAPSPLMDHVAAIPPDDGTLSDEEWLRRALDAARARDLVADVDALAMNKDDGDMADDSFDRPGIHPPTQSEVPTTTETTPTRPHPSAGGSRATRAGTEPYSSTTTTATRTTCTISSPPSTASRPSSFATMP